MSTHRILGALLAAAASVPLAASPRGQAGGYAIVATYPVGEEGSWDYLIPDTVGHRLFVSRSTRIMVVDEATGKVLGEVPGINGAHGIAMDYATRHGFATSGNDSSVVMFDLGSLAVLGRTPADVDADAILYDPASKHVFTMNGDGNTSSVIDPVTGKRILNIPLGGKPEYGVTANDGMVYINLTDKNEIVEIDAVAMRVLRRWSLAPCTGPSGLAIDRAHHLLISGCHSGVMAISSIADGKVVTTVPIGSGVDANAFDPATGNAFSSNGDGTLTIAHEDSPTTFRAWRPRWAPRPWRSTRSSTGCFSGRHGIRPLRRRRHPRPAAGEGGRRWFRDPS